MTRRTSGIVTNVLLGAVGVVATGVIITNAVRGECAMCAMFAGSSDTEEASPETGPVDPSVVATSPSVDPDDQGNDASTDPDLSDTDGRVPTDDPTTMDEENGAG